MCGPMDSRFSGLLLIASLLMMPAAAQQSATPEQATSKPQAHRAVPSLDPGAVSDNVYRNPSFGLSYKIPFGWVDRTEQMQQDSEPEHSAVLLAVFERPPEVTENGINPGVIVAAESASGYPGLKSAEDYFGPLAEVAGSHGVTPESDPYKFTVGGQQLAREDSLKKVGDADFHQSTLVELHKGYIVSFTFIAATEDEVNSLIENLSFARNGQSGPHSSSKRP